ncbi:DUF4256 domain-containing protein [Acinetobacter sp. A3.8]|uniref:DUF4256 domain-containing protein n=1 Tax=Acinetobacter sedimenti TaxID=2919922 RepID=A0A9X2B5N7_9GAMM|nr:DUF4256 domain-containing protein [Acinetobacter sedimenti]MCJ8145778.1 DUF4256 domain-containing protein [Acinetobacter sedimenti]
MSKQNNELIDILKTRFEQNMQRHPNLDWAKVEEKLLVHPKKLKALQAMEDTDGEPDVIGFDAKNNEYLFVDCSVESPKGRRSLCYDAEALAARKQHQPADSAVNLAKKMGINLLTEQQYRDLQQLGEFDLKTSSWIDTPQAIRALGGALFCDRRYDQVFTYHNGAESYYAARGFRGMLRV